MELPGRWPWRAADRRYRLRQIDDRGRHHDTAPAGQPHHLQQGGGRRDQGTQPALLCARSLQVRAERGNRHVPARPAARRDRLLRAPRGLGQAAVGHHEETVTLAQVFWMRDGAAGQPDRFFVVADRGLAVEDDFTNFGSDILALKKRLRAAGARIHDHFPEYGKDYRRALGIESEQAMELFQQTVSMKSVGNLTDFVRSHMLEPFDSESWTKRIIGHFEDLTKAHDAVRRAQAQLELLQPLLADCATHDS